MSKNTIYALWYVFMDNQKSACGISFGMPQLEDLHQSAVTDPDSYYHKYKHTIFKMSITSIRAFTYKDKRLYPITENTILQKDFSFYASYSQDSTSELEEIIIHMSKEDHANWRKCREDKLEYSLESEFPFFFYYETISHGPVRLNTYYAEGILNA